MNKDVEIPHLFRTEYSKVIAVLCKTFGVSFLPVAEDIASETFLLAAETWGQKGLPAHPVAWLYAVSKNKAKDAIKHDHIYTGKVVPYLRQASEEMPAPEIDLSGDNITDSQLRMMFAVCHPVIPAEAQVGLALNVLCGFGIEEIADAFLTSREAIYKRLSRAKEKLRNQNISIEMPAPAEMTSRQGPVLTTLYLLFSEGYYSTSQNMILRKDLCLEAMRMCLMLIDNERTNSPEANALLALMCFHSSRFEARFDQSGALILYQDQDEGLWNKELILRGTHYLNRAAKGKRLSKYHLEAGIAFWHTHQQDTTVKWENILQLYNKLLQIEYSPIAALNRTYALAKANGPREAINEAEKLGLDTSHLYHLLLAKLYEGIELKKAIAHLHTAHELARTETEKNNILQILDQLKAAGK